MTKGDNIFFYRSRDIRSVTALGIIEDVKISSSPIEIMEFVSDRTVYSFDDIRELCTAPVLAIKFRRVMFFDPPIFYDELKLNGVLTGAPQSILEINEEGLTWLKTKV